MDRSAPEGEPGMTRQRILVVDDDAHDREIYGKMLWYNGFDVIFAENGAEGLRLAREQRPDLMLMDVVMPGLDGLTLCARLKEQGGTAAIPVILLTGLRRPGLARRAADTGCLRLLEKPVSPLEVLREIEDVVGRPPPASPDADEPEQGPGVTM